MRSQKLHNKILKKMLYLKVGKRSGVKTIIKLLHFQVHRHVENGSNY